MSESGLLAHEAAAGNAAAFGTLVRQHQSKLRGFLLRMTRGNHALADDLAQETFLEAFRKIAQFGTGSFFGWLCAIAYSRYLMEARKRKLEPLDEADDVAADAPETEFTSAVKLDVEKAMAQLAPPQRAALTLCFALGFSNEEAAAALDMPLGTLKSHVNRGRKKLAVLLDAWRNRAVS
ncbi:MAG: RNA polymerase sigma factor [Alphaproteobacteria bacterium]|nr:RNA polymerase sigma factor [Alphaproteobacteria bacterium]